MFTISALIAGALTLRLYAIVTSYNLFIDEVTYATVTRNLASGHGVTLYDDQPFDLHPPFAFAVLALYGKITHALGRPIQDVAFALRPVSAMWGTVTVVLVYLLLRQTSAGNRGAVLGASMLLLDPFAILFDSRVMLEAQSQCLVALSLMFLALAANNQRRKRVFIPLSGLAAAMAVCTKETFGLVLVLTLLILVVVPSVLPRKQPLAVIGMACVGYAISLVAVGLSTGFGVWWHARTDGLARLIGTKQVTGFNAPTTQVSLTSRLAADLSSFGVTYLVLAAGGVATVAMVIQGRMWRKNPIPGSNRTDRLVLAWSLSSCLYLGYATLFGSIEAQMYYITLAPNLIVLCVAVHQLWVVRARAARLLVALVCVAAIAWDGNVWVLTHTHDSNVYRRMMAWEPEHIPPGSRISVTEYVSQFLLNNAIIGQWATLPELKTNDVRYVIIGTTLVKQGYGLGTPAFLKYLQTHGAVEVFSAHDYSDGGELVIYDVRAITGSS
jgi:dolichyl-phosphate-mannose-protein mannosyltransferase